MHRFAWLLVLPACFGKSNAMTGGVTTGAITTPMREDRVIPGATAELTTTERDHRNGVEFRAFAANTMDDAAIPNAYGMAVRQLGEGAGIQSSIQAGWMVTHKVGSATVFGRLMFDLLSWTEIGEETTLSALSPTFDVGIAPFGHGLCVSAAATWDVKFNDPDRGLVGVFVGICGGALKR
jgi:hypothetical protein